MKVLTLAEFQGAMRSQEVPQEHMAVKCPMCGTVQSMTSLIRAGAGPTPSDVEKYVGFSCVGRFQGGPSPTEAREKGIACNWTLGGLFKLHTLEVEIEGGKRVPTFEPATKEEAQALMAGAA